MGWKACNGWTSPHNNHWQWDRTATPKIFRKIFRRIPYKTGSKYTYGACGIDLPDKRFIPWRKL